MGVIQAIQDLHGGSCFGCGSNNDHGLRIKSYWDGQVARCEWEPEPYHVGGPDWVYGGIIASVMDCHCAAAAMYAAYDAEGRAPDTPPQLYYVTARLNVTYLKPTPIGKPLLFEAQVDKLEGRKAYVRCTLTVDGEECAQCSALFVRPRQAADVTTEGTESTDN